MKMKLLIGITGAIGSLLCLWYAPDAMAQAPDAIKQDGFNPFRQGFGRFEDTIRDQIDGIFDDGQPYKNFVNILWTALAMYVVLKWAAQGMARGFRLDELLAFVFMLMFTKYAIDDYVKIIDLLWEWSGGFGTVLQTGLLVTSIDSDDGPWAAVSFIFKMVLGITVTFGNPIFAFDAVLAATVIVLILLILAIVSGLTIAWAYWGFILAKLMGLMVIPFLLVRNLSWIFDAWFRFLFGFLIYSVVARVNVTLVAVALFQYFNARGEQAATGAVLKPLVPVTIEPGSPFELMGLATFCIIGIFALVSTGKFAAALSGGSDISLGSAVSQVAVGLSRAAMMVR